MQRDGVIKQPTVCNGEITCMVRVAVCGVALFTGPKD
jgi:hypothetical protein